MPNHITTKLTFRCEDAGKREALNRDILDIEGRMDFNKFVPMPEQLANTTDGSADEHKAQMEKNFKETGFKSWYDWSNANWGTKWNSYDNTLPYEPVEVFNEQGKGLSDLELATINEDLYNDCIAEGVVAEEIYFDTAWCFPYEVMEKMSEQHPTTEFEFQWADEDTPHNSGKLKLLSGYVTEYSSYRDCNNFASKANAACDAYELKGYPNIEGQVEDEDGEHHDHTVKCEIEQIPCGTIQVRSDKATFRRYNVRQERITPALEFVMPAVGFNSMELGHAIEAYYTALSYSLNPKVRISVPNIAVPHTRELTEISKGVADVMRADLLTVTDLGKEINLDEYYVEGNTLLIAITPISEMVDVAEDMINLADKLSLMTEWQKGKSVLIMMQRDDANYDFPILLT